MAIDKGLYQAPQGIADAQDSPIEIEIVDPEKVSITADGIELDIEPGGDEDFSKNLAEEMSDSELQTLGSELIALVDSDISARKDWTDTYVDGLKLIGA